MPVYALTDKLIFPNPDQAHESGILAVGGDLSIERLLLAYSAGIFPWYSEGEPITWWAPDPRAVLYPDNLKITDSMRRVMKSGRFEITFDTDFRAVISRCKTTRRKDQAGTWITPEMMEAYCRLHEAGYAHSVETRQDGKLVGGLYGVSLGRVFYGESMFSRVSNASKAALITLTEWLKKRDFAVIDCQVPTGHLISMGSTVISRADFLQLLRQALKPRTLFGPWQPDPPAGP